MKKVDFGGMRSPFDSLLFVHSGSTLCPSTRQSPIS